MRPLRWKVWMSLIAIAAVSIVLAIPIERHKRAMGRRASFHAEKARVLWGCVQSSEDGAMGSERRSKLGVPSEANESWFRIGSGPPVMLSPAEWGEWAARFRENVVMYRMMAEQREATERAYRRAMTRPWESAPTNVISDYEEK